MDKYEKKLEKHRVIGIRHALKAFKDDGLLDDDTFYPDDAVNEIKDDMLQLARKWYRIGARRGALETLGAFLIGDIEIRKNKKGGIEIIANKTDLSWRRGLNVTIGAEKKHIKRHKYKLGMKSDLGLNIKKKSR
jgi:hypothetical protein